MASESIGFNNAIGYAQFQLRGGWRTILTTTSAYGLVIIAAIYLIVRLTQAPGGGGAGRVLHGWTIGLLLLQSGVLILFACSRVAAAIKQDMQTQMIESHRLMPISAGSAIIGYLIGPTAQAMGLATANLLIGAFIANAAGLSITAWVIANATLLLFALFVATAVCCGTLVTGTGLVWLFLAVPMIVWTEGLLLDLLPGLKVLLHPLIGRSIFSVSNWSFYPSWRQLLPYFLQVWLAAVFFAGAMRRYRRPERPALGELLGLALLGAWIAMCVLALLYPQDYANDALDFRSGVDPATQMVASLLVAMLMAFSPLSSAAWSTAAWQRARDVADPALPQRPLPSMLTLVCAAGLILLLPVMMVHRPIDQLRVLSQTAVVVLAFMLGALGSIRVLYRLGWRPRFLVVLWLGSMWIGPLVVDWVRQIMIDGEATRLGVISAASPIGALMHIWRLVGNVSDGPVLLTGGLVFQGAMGIALLLAAMIIERRQSQSQRPAIRHRAPPAAATPNHRASSSPP